MNGAWTFEGVAALRERDIEEAGMHERKIGRAHV